MYRDFVYCMLICSTCVAPLAVAADGDLSARVAVARKLEATKPVADYQRTALFPAIGPALQRAMGTCLAQTGAKEVRFRLVADVAPDGHFTQIVHEPDTALAACVAEAAAAFRAPPPPGGVALPLVIDMLLTP